MSAQLPGRGHDSARLAEFFTRLSLTDVPHGVVERARMVLLDSLGCGLFGATQPWSAAAVRAARRDRSEGACTIFGREETIAAPLAALCNGVAIHGYELDDLIAESVVHPGAVVVPAVLAAAQSAGASGERVLLGVIAGYDTMSRVGLALGLEPARRGYHTTGLAGPVAAAMAAGVTLGYPADRVLSAMGLACSASAGVKSFAGGSGGGMVKRMHAGRSAEAGVRMCELADCGFDGPRAAIDGRFGLLEVMAGDSAAPGRLSETLGEEWALEQVWVKMYPICGLIQAVAQVIDRIKRDTGLCAADVARIRVGMSHHGLRHNAEQFPADAMAAQYSIPFCAATAIASDAADPLSYAPDRLNDPVTRDLAARTELSFDADVERAYPARFGARVTLELRDRTRREGFELSPHGTPDRPCTADELAQKFKRLGRVSHTGAQLDALVDLVSRVDQLESVRSISMALRCSTAAH